jgi:hypothetical protein
MFFGESLRTLMHLAARFGPKERRTWPSSTNRDVSQK